MKQLWRAQATFAPSLPEAMLPVSLQRSLASLKKSGSVAPALQKGDRSASQSLCSEVSEILW
jgi:hypothetical protein